MDNRMIWSVNILLASLVMMFTRYERTLYRFWLALVDIVTSLGFYFCMVFEPFFGGEETEIPRESVPINQIPEIDLKEYIGFDLEELTDKLSLFWEEFFDLYNLAMFFVDLLDFLYQTSFYIVMFLPPLLIIFLAGKDLLCSDKEKDIGYQSRAYRAFLWLCEHVLLPVYRLLSDFAHFFYERKKVFSVFVVVWLVNLNLLTIGVEVLAFYFYFIASFDILSVGIQLVKLLIDLLIMLNSAPLLFWGAVGLVCYILWAIAKGFDELQHMEAKDCGFIKSIAMIILVVGPPGFGKTQLITDMAACAFFGGSGYVER